MSERHLINNQFAPPASIIFYGAFPMSDKKVMEISRDGIWVSPDVSVDEAAKAVLNAIDGHIKKLVQEAVSREREWVGLTNNEIQEIVDRIKVDDLLLKTSTWHLRFARAVQRKLREKNT